MKTSRHPLPRSPLSLAVLFAITSALAGGCELQTDSSKEGGAYWDANTTSDVSGGDFRYDVEGPELAYRFLAPKASRDYVFVPNETLDTVSKIDADTLAITSVPVCDRPTRLEAVEQLNMAVVLCQNSDELGVIHADDVNDRGETVDTTVFMDIDQRMNTLTLAPDARYAFAYFTYSGLEDGDPTGSLQTLSMVRTAQNNEAFFSLSVGFQIRSITYRTAKDFNGLLQVTHAYVVTDTGISVLELASIDGDQVLPVIPVSPHHLDDPLDREVQVTPSGEYAVVRDMGVAEFYIVRLSDGEITTVPIDAPATDVDLFPSDGSPTADEDRALLVVREANEVLDVSVEAVFAEPSLLTPVNAGGTVKGLASIGPDGRYAVLYTTLGGLDELTIVDTADTTVPARILPLRKSIVGAAISADGGFAIVLHPSESAEGLDGPAAIVAQSPGYSIVDLESGFTRLVLSDAPVEDLTFWTGDEGTAHAYLSFNDEVRKLWAVDRITLDTFAVSPLQLGSPPSDLGRVTGRGRVWVNQEHPVGRMTFIDVASGEPKTVTGFELNRFVR